MIPDELQHDGGCVTMPSIFVGAVTGVWSRLARLARKAQPTRIICCTPRAARLPKSAHMSFRWWRFIFFPAHAKKVTNSFFHHCDQKSKPSCPVSFFEDLWRKFRIHIKVSPPTLLKTWSDSTKGDFCAAGIPRNKSKLSYTFINVNRCGGKSYVQMWALLTITIYGLSD